MCCHTKSSHAIEPVCVAAQSYMKPKSRRDCN
jgi:hypothetical protein